MKRILILSANPKNTDRLRLGEEMRAVQTAVNQSSMVQQFEVMLRPAVRVDDLQRVLLADKPHIVHFSGHGADTQGLTLENELGQLQLVSTQALADLFRLFQTDIECVFLNACYSATQAEAIQQYIDCVVGTNQAVGDKAAIAFAQGFYRGIETGKPYDQAFRLGCYAIDLQGIPDSLTPVLKYRHRGFPLEKLDDLGYSLSSPMRRDFIDWREMVEGSPPPHDRPCYIYAEMEDRVIIHRVTTLEVTVSGDKIEFQSGPTTQGGTVSVNSDESLTVQVIAKTNFAVVDEDRVEIAPPALGQRHQFYFDLRPTNLGAGEVWVVVRQGQMPLLTLFLEPQIMENRAQVRQAFTALMSSAPPSAGAEQPSDLSSSKSRAAGSITEFPSPSYDPLHQLRIIEQRNGDQITYRYEIDSPTLELLKSFVSAPISSKRQEYVENLYKEIEARWLSNQDDVEAFTAELRAFGGNLFDELFPSELRTLLWQYQSQIKSIMVISTEPFIPWELVHLKQPGQTHLPEETKFLGQMGLVRWLYGTFPPQTIQIREGRVFYVIPHYPDKRHRLPQAEQESQFLEQTFHAKAIRPQSTPVRQMLGSGNFDLLHFAGHGVAEQENIGNAKLMMQGRMEGDRYIPDYLSATTIEQFSKLRSVDNNRPLVVLNACQIGREGYTLTSIGGFAQAFLKGGAGAFIGPLWSVGDRPARVFTETLYEKLRMGLLLSEATIKAREQASQVGDATWLAYAVYGHPHMKITLI